MSSGSSSRPARLAAGGMDRNYSPTSRLMPTTLIHNTLSILHQQQKSDDDEEDVDVTLADSEDNNTGDYCDYDNIPKHGGAAYSSSTLPKNSSTSSHHQQHGGSTMPRHLRRRLPKQNSIGCALDAIARGEVTVRGRSRTRSNDTNTDDTTTDDDNLQKNSNISGSNKRIGRHSSSSTGGAHHQKTTPTNSTVTGSQSQTLNVSPAHSSLSGQRKRRRRRAQQQQSASNADKSIKRKSDLNKADVDDATRAYLQLLAYRREWARQANQLLSADANSGEPPALHGHDYELLKEYVLAGDFSKATQYRHILKQIQEHQQQQEQQEQQQQNKLSLPPAPKSASSSTLSNTSFPPSPSFTTLPPSASTRNLNNSTTTIASGVSSEEVVPAESIDRKPPVTNLSTSCSTKLKVLHTELYEHSIPRSITTDELSSNATTPVLNNSNLNGDDDDEAEQTAAASSSGHEAMLYELDCCQREIDVCARQLDEVIKQRRLSTVSTEKESTPLSQPPPVAPARESAQTKPVAFAPANGPHPQASSVVTTSGYVSGDSSGKSSSNTTQTSAAATGTKFSAAQPQINYTTTNNTRFSTLPKTSASVSTAPSTTTISSSPSNSSTGSERSKITATTYYEYEEPVVYLNDKKTSAAANTSNSKLSDARIWRSEPQFTCTTTLYDFACEDVGFSNNNNMILNDVELTKLFSTSIEAIDRAICEEHVLAAAAAAAAAANSSSLTASVQQPYNTITTRTTTTTAAHDDALQSSQPREFATQQKRLSLGSNIVANIRLLNNNNNNPGSDLKQQTFSSSKSTNNFGDHGFYASSSSANTAVSINKNTHHISSSNPTQITNEQPSNSSSGDTLNGAAGTSNDTARTTHNKLASLLFAPKARTFDESIQQQAPATTSTSTSTTTGSTNYQWGASSSSNQTLVNNRAPGSGSGGLAATTNAGATTRTATTYSDFGSLTLAGGGAKNTTGAEDMLQQQSVFMPNKQIFGRSDTKKQSNDTKTAKHQQILTNNGNNNHHQHSVPTHQQQQIKPSSSSHYSVPAPPPNDNNNMQPSTSSKKPTKQVTEETTTIVTTTAEEQDTPTVRNVPSVQSMSPALSELSLHGSSSAVVSTPSPTPLAFGLTDPLALAYCERLIGSRSEKSSSASSSNSFNNKAPGGGIEQHSRHIPLDVIDLAGDSTQRGIGSIKQHPWFSQKSTDQANSDQTTKTSVQEKHDNPSSSNWTTHNNMYTSSNVVNLSNSNNNNSTQPSSYGTSNVHKVRYSSSKTSKPVLLFPSVTAAAATSAATAAAMGGGTSYGSELMRSVRENTNQYVSTTTAEQNHQRPTTLSEQQTPQLQHNMTSDRSRQVAFIRNAVVATAATAVPSVAAATAHRSQSYSTVQRNVAPSATTSSKSHFQDPPSLSSTAKPSSSITQANNTNSSSVFQKSTCLPRSVAARATKTNDDLPLDNDKSTLSVKEKIRMFADQPQTAASLKITTPNVHIRRLASFTTSKNTTTNNNTSTTAAPSTAATAYRRRSCYERRDLNDDDDDSPQQQKPGVITTAGSMPRLPQHQTSTTSSGSSSGSSSGAEPANNSTDVIYTSSRIQNLLKSKLSNGSSAKTGNGNAARTKLANSHNNGSGSFYDNDLGMANVDDDLGVAVTSF